ncbi:SOS response-associated peptidase [Duganella sp. Dugasp56]|uniref:SOS response-associated peptidase n=1 Tax=Duganella sp. Dugasp56 TaxID=3243046 RepID=UPI0039AEA2AE
MCVNFRPPDPAMLESVMGVIIDLHDTGFWKTETWKDYGAPIVRHGAGGREGVLASYGMYPMKFQRQAHEARIAKLPLDAPAEKKKFKAYDTMNARSETVGQLPTYSSAWKRTQLCLVPMTAFYEPCYESGKPVRWGIGMADQSMFAVAGLWREWESEAGKEASFTQLTMNADDHPLMRRFHKPGDEKRALVIVPQEEWDDWLECKDPERARSFLRPYPAELMTSWEYPVPPRAKKAQEPAPAETLDLGF